MADELTNVNGVDVSNNNGEYNLASLSGLDFVFAKVSEGNFYTDNTYSYFRNQAASLGVLFGSYHFAHPEAKNPTGEATLFMQNADLKSGSPIWIDYEVYSGNNSYDAQWINTFRNEIRANYHNAKVGLYADLTGMRQVLGHVTVDGLWLAWYNGQPETPTGPMPHGFAWNIHQYEIVNGLDRDYSRWSLSQMKKAFTW